MAKYRVYGTKKPVRVYADIEASSAMEAVDKAERMKLENWNEEDDEDDTINVNGAYSMKGE